MVPELVDIGCNLTHQSFADDREALLARAHQAGVSRLIVTGADLQSSRQASQMAAANPQRLSSTAGVHPHHAAGFSAESRDEFLMLLGRPEVVAVGECGLDYFRDLSPRLEQRAAFIAQLEIAVTVRKPVFLHQRDAHGDFVAILKDYRTKLSGAVAHCFTGGTRELDDYLALDLSIGVTGWICDDRRGESLRLAVPHIPATSLMIETDAPYLLPRDLAPAPKSRRNEPCYLPHIARRLSELRGVVLAELASTTTRNAQRFFGLTPTIS